VAPENAGGWQRLSDQATEWRPMYSGARSSLFETYGKGEQRVELYLGVYRNQKQDAELINSRNLMVVQKHPVWSNVGESQRLEVIAGSAIPARQTLLRSADQRLLIWNWFVVAGSDVVNPYLAKLLQARDQIVGRGDDGVAIIVAAPYEDTGASAEAALRDFLATMRPALDASVAKAFGGQAAARSQTSS
jgi:EpsI family protein